MTPVESIDQLVADGIVDALIQRVKTGKEAEVFVVRKGESYFAAKVYKERNARNFRNNVAYREGRQVRNTRDQRAMAKGTKYGLAMSESDWMHTEHDALVTALNAEVRVPKPELFYEGVLLMELVLGTDGQPAPRLIDVPLSPEEAVALHRDVFRQIVALLTCDLIHGDLSPYNILMAWNGPTIIDLPQVVKAAHNSQSEKFLVRDVRNVTEHFARYAPELRRRVNDGYAVWRKYMRRELTPEYFPDEAESSQSNNAHANAQGGGRAHPQHRGPRPAHAGPTHGPRPTTGSPAPHRPETAARPDEPAHTGNAPRPNGARPAHGHRPQRPNVAPASRGGGSPPPRPGPIIQRVTRLATPTHGSAPARADGATEAKRPGRFSMHHRHR